MPVHAVRSHTTFVSFTRRIYEDHFTPWATCAASASWSFDFNVPLRTASSLTLAASAAALQAGAWPMPSGHCLLHLGRPKRARSTRITYLFGNRDASPNSP